MLTQTTLKTGNLPNDNPLQGRGQPGTLLALAILTAVTLACLLPFLGKAFHTDDPLFIWTGRHLLMEPWNFYHFNVNWYGKEQPMSAAMQNPPLASYYLALAGLVLGWNEVGLHAGFLLPALAMVWGTYRLAKRFCSHPMAAGLVTIAAPVFLVSSTNVMCDTMMMALWVWSVDFWMEGLAKYSPMNLWISVLLMAACGLTKYFGFALVPLVGAYSLAQRRKLGSWLAYLFFPILVLLLYEWLTYRLYGRGALADGLEYARNERAAHDLHFKKIVVEFSFIGGCLIVLLFAAPLLWGRRMLAAGTAALVAFGVAVVSHQRIGHVPTWEAGHVNWLFVIQFTLFVAAGAVLMLLTFADLLRHKTADALLLFLWAGGTFIFVYLTCWQISGRYLLPLVPVASILLIRRLEIRQLLHERNQLGLLWIPLGISLTVALMVARADFKLANCSRSAAVFIRQKAAEAPTIWFEGHWGFQYYMESLGARPVDFWQLRFNSKDALALPLQNSNVFPPPPQFVFWFDYDCKTSRYLTTMSPFVGAGFYSDGWGPVPFLFCQVTPQHYEIFRAK